MSQKKVAVRLSTTDARKLVGLLGDFVFIVESFPGARDVLDDFPVSLGEKRSNCPLYFMRRIQNSILRASKGADAGWAKGIPTTNEYR